MRLWRETPTGWSAVAVDGPLSVGCATIVPFVAAGSAGAVLIVAPGAAVTRNGAVPLGAAVLAARDEIVIGNDRLVFWPYAPGEPGLFDGPGGERCARCATALVATDVCIRCPACRAHHHATDGLPCWTYDERCGACGRLRSEFAWAPGDGDAAC